MRRIKLVVLCILFKFRIIRRVYVNYRIAHDYAGMLKILYEVEYGNGHQN